VIDDGITAHKLILRNLKLQQQRRALMHRATLSQRHRGNIETEVVRQFADQPVQTAAPGQFRAAMPILTDNRRN
jgi:hypothetical protein